MESKLSENTGNCCDLFIFHYQILIDIIQPKPQRLVSMKVTKSILNFNFVFPFLFPKIVDRRDLFALHTLIHTNQGDSTLLNIYKSICPSLEIIDHFIDRKLLLYSFRIYLHNCTEMKWRTCEFRSQSNERGAVDDKHPIKSKINNN